MTQAISAQPTYEGTLECYFFEDDRKDFIELHGIAMRLIAIREELDSVKTATLFKIRRYVPVLALRREREELYKKVRKADWQTRCDVYDCLPAEKRDYIPGSVWNYGSVRDNYGW